MKKHSEFPLRTEYQAMNQEMEAKATRQKRVAALGAGLLLTVSGAGLLGSGSEASPAQTAPDPTAAIEDIATTPEGKQVSIVDNNYAEAQPDDPTKMKVVIGGDANGDGYIDNVSVQSPKDQ